MSEDNLKNLKKTLDDANIKYPEDASEAQLKELLPPVERSEAEKTILAEEDKAKKLAAVEKAKLAKKEEETAKKAEADGEIKVEDAEVFKPKDLPLLITRKGGWKNDAQAEYAKTLNGYAYKNPEKWAKKKPALLARLNEIGDDPEAIIKYRGVDVAVTVGNNSMESAKE